MSASAPSAPTPAKVWSRRFAATDERDALGIELRRQRQGQFGVGLVLVGGVTRDLGMSGRPRQSSLGGRVEIAHQMRRLETGGERVVEAAVDGHPDGVIRRFGSESGDQIGIER